MLERYPGIIKEKRAKPIRNLPKILNILLTRRVFLSLWENFFNICN